jgi:hypothetical protein
MRCLHRDGVGAPAGRITASIVVPLPTTQRRDEPTLTRIFH